MRGPMAYLAEMKRIMERAAELQGPPMGPKIMLSIPVCCVEELVAITVAVAEHRKNKESKAAPTA